MEHLTFSPALMESLSFLSKNLTGGTRHTRRVPTVNSLGQPITEVKQLAVCMGVSERVAAAYAINAGNEELKADAVEVLYPGIYNAFEDGYEPVYHYAYDVASRIDLNECKRIRMVRTASGVRKFQQNLGSVIVTEGEQPLDALKAVQNDVPGYDKLIDKGGNPYYVGREGKNWVVRSGQSGAVLFQSENIQQGQADALTWLNSRVGGRRQSSHKSIEVEVETKRNFTQMSVDRLGKQGHAFRNSNGEYSYPISNVADLKNAIHAFGRAKASDREKLKAYIKRRARALKHPELIPDGWKSGMPEGFEVKTIENENDLHEAIHNFDQVEPENEDALKEYIKQRAIDLGVDLYAMLDDSEQKDWNIEPGKNWVENTGSLPHYIERVAKAIFRSGKHTRSQAIAIAVSRIKRWATGVGVDADTQAKAVAALAQWEALKAKNKARMAARKAKKG